MSQWCRSALCGHSLPAPTDNWTHSAASRHTIAPISHTRPSPRSRSYYSFPVPLRVGDWVGPSTQYVSDLLNVACSGPGVSRTRNLSVMSPILYQLDHCTRIHTFIWQQRTDWPLTCCNSVIKTVFKIAIIKTILLCTKWHKNVQYTSQYHKAIFIQNSLGNI